ncbi:hypothetical protein F4561_002661 [Lipingzhangella halophila]|uniref:Uncharacterized protein n=1 Tax=Lipingzhangella halophila TaxID=1783352 RepID=A0A7W7RI18_9ACTN|nr:hypothetical protein [Lipingzhangella halophila]MBB4931841.1 hypothetical protein [Lipingzhangella halophila]
MPRTRAAVAGLDPGRPWDETNGQLALLDTRIQAVHGLLWVGLRLKGKAPKVQPYPVPEVKKAAEPKKRSEKPKVNERHKAYLDRFSPGKAPPAAPPARRKPKDRPPGRPGMAERHRAYLDRFAPPKH